MQKMQFNEVLSNMDDDVQAKAAFLLEQLYLLSNPVNSRRYACDLFFYLASEFTITIQSTTIRSQYLIALMLTSGCPKLLKLI